MKKQLCWLLSASAAVLALGVTSEARAGKPDRGCAIQSPWDSPDPPGYNSANSDIDKKGAFHPYYSPLIPVSLRWGYTEVVPYYCGYCRKWSHCTRCAHCGTGGYCGEGGGAEIVYPINVGAVGTYGAFTGAGRDANLFWRLGGNGAVPCGTPQPPRSGPPDIIDLIGTRRGQH